MVSLVTADFNVLSSTKAHLSLAKGYEARMTLYPFQQLGVFTAFTGNQLSYSAQSALHAAIADIILDQNTWLNTSTICSFPAPWVLVPKEIRRPQPENQPRQSNKYKSYYGVYYNEIYGRIIVFQNITIGKLQMQYGPIRSDLRQMSSKNVFHAQGEGDFWLFKVTVTFHFSPGKSGFLTIPEYVPNSPTNPIRFKLTNTKIPNEYSQHMQTSTSSAPSVPNERVTQGATTEPITPVPSVASTQLTTERQTVTERSSIEEGQIVTTLGSSTASEITSTSDIPRSSSPTQPEVTKDPSQFPQDYTSVTSSGSHYPVTGTDRAFSASYVSREQITETIPQTQFTDVSSESILPQRSLASTTPTSDSDVTSSTVKMYDVTSFSAHGVDTVSSTSSYADVITRSTGRVADNTTTNFYGMTSPAKVEGVTLATRGIHHSTPEYKTSDVKNSKSRPDDKNIVDTESNSFNGCASRTFTITSIVWHILIYFMVVYVKL